jgi:hypothetical protein
MLTASLLVGAFCASLAATEGRHVGFTLPPLSQRKEK